MHFSGKDKRRKANGGSQGDDDDRLSPSAFIGSRDIDFDFPKAAELHCCDLFNYRRPCGLNSLGFRQRLRLGSPFRLGADGYVNFLKTEGRN
jgi:hypothetical protein